MREYELYHANRKHKYIKKIGNRYFYTQQEIAAYLKEKKGDVTFEKNDYGEGGKDYRLDFNKEKGSYTDSKGKKHTYTMSDGIGVRIDKKNKNVELYNTTNKTYWKNDEKLVRQDRGRVTTSYAEDGVSRRIDLSKDKHNIKSEKDRWEKLKENGVDYDSPSEYRQKQRKKAAKKVSKNIKKTMSSMKKQASRGKKKIESMSKPKSTVKVIDRVDSRTGKHF